MAPSPAMPKALLAKEHDARRKSIDAGIASLRQNSHDEKRLLSALSGFEFFDDGDDLGLFFAQLGGVDLLLAVLRRHLKSASVCMTVSKIFCNLTYADEVGDDVREMIAVRGGLDLLVAALRSHPANASVNQFACDTLGNLALNTDNQVTIVALGGLELIFDALRNHPTNAEVNSSACWAPASLAKNTDNQVMIVARGCTQTALRRTT